MWCHIRPYTIIINDIDNKYIININIYKIKGNLVYCIRPHDKGADILRRVISPYKVSNYEY